MKKFVISLLMIALLPCMAEAQKQYPTGITPYTFCSLGDGHAKSGRILKKLGYRSKAGEHGEYTYTFSGKYANKIKDISEAEGVYGDGAFWLELKFKTIAGANYFESLLRKANYVRERIYDDASEYVWKQKGNDEVIYQGIGDDNTYFFR